MTVLGFVVPFLIVAGSALLAYGAWRTGYGQGADNEEDTWLNRVAELADGVESAQASGRSQMVDGDSVVTVLDRWLDRRYEI